MGKRLGWQETEDDRLSSEAAREFPDLPEFLKVENSVPLSPKLESALRKVQAVLQVQNVDRWRQREEMRKAEKREKAREQATAARDKKEIEAQIAKHKLKHPDRVEQRLISLGMLKPRPGGGGSRHKA